MKIDTHPTPQQLAAFAQGKLSAADQSTIQSHLNDCDSCCQALDQGPTDAIAQLLRRAGSPTPAVVPDTVNPHSALSPTVQIDVPPELVNHPRYRVVKLLGKGGMGAVYQAEHRVMKRMVALKIIGKQFTTNPEAVQRFRREVEAAAKLDHPNIVRAHDAEQMGDTHFLVMEHVDGKNLAEVVQERGPLPVATACQYIRQVAAGLQHACERGMVHRDIKPQNLMLTPDGAVKILDFGLARFVREKRITNLVTQYGVVMGTPDFMAPEQARDTHLADIRSDIYSLGCTLYYLLTGRVPFPGDGPLEKLRAHLDQKATPLHELRRDVNVELTQFVERLMAKAPAQRPQSPLEVFQALATFIGPPPEEAAQGGRSTAPMQLVEATRRFIRQRWPWLAGGSVLFALVIWLVFFRGSTPPVPPIPQRNPEFTEYLFKHEDISAQTLANVGLGKHVPPELVAVLGDSGFRIRDEPGFFAYSPNGQWLAVPSWNEVFIFQAESGKVVRVLSGHSDRVYSLIFSKDSQILATGGKDRSIRLWDMDSGQQTCAFQNEDPVALVALSPDGKWLAASSEKAKKVRIFDVEKRELKRVLEQEAVIFGVAFYSDDTLLCAAEDGRTYSWNIATGNLWGAPIILQPEPNSHASVVFAPDGGYLAFGSANRLKVLPGKSKETAKRQPFERDTPANFLAFAPNGLLFTGGHDLGDRQHHIIKRWDLSTQEADSLPLRSWDDFGFYGLHPSGDVLAGLSSAERYVRRYNATTGKDVVADPGHTARVFSVAFSPDGKWLASAAEDRTVRLWDLAAGKTKHILKHQRGVFSVAFSPDNELLASAGVDGAISLCKVSDGSPVGSLAGRPRTISLVAFSPDGQYLVNGTIDGAIQFWRVKTQERLDPIPGAHKGWIRCVKYSPDGKLLASAGDDGKIILREAATHAVVKSLSSVTGSSMVTNLDFHENGKLLAASYGRIDGAAHAMVRIWDLETGKEAAWPCHGDNAGGIAFQPKGNILASSSIDGTIRLWDARPPHPSLRDPLGPFGGGAFEHIAISPNGRLLAAGTASGTIYLFQLPRP